MNHGEAAGLYCCRACGAALRVRVGFKGKFVWAVDPENPAFGDSEPEVLGERQEPQIVCSADPLHKTGFSIREGAIVPE
jgi:hypothetical protein